MGVTWFDFPRSRSDEQPGETHRLHLVPVALVPLRTNPLPDLDESTVSTRALYGNRDHRPPFPGLFPRPIPVSNLALTELDPGNGEPQQQITAASALDPHRQPSPGLDLAANRDRCPPTSRQCLLGLLPPGTARPTEPPRPARWRHTPTTSALETVDVHAQMCRVVRHVCERRPGRMCGMDGDDEDTSTGSGPRDSDRDGSRP
jgi:hypothetical protein